MSEDLTRTRVVEEGTLIPAPQHHVQLFADQVDSPVTEEWAVNSSAPARVDDTDRRLVVRSFDDTSPEGIGFTLMFPGQPSQFFLDVTARTASPLAQIAEFDFEVHLRSLWSDAEAKGWVRTTAPEPFLVRPEDSGSYRVYRQGPFLIPPGLGPHIQFEVVRRPTERTTGDLLVLNITASFDS